MFDQIGDLPLHPLAVHAPIVLLPLAAVVAIAYAMVLPWRRFTGWAVAFLAAASALGSWVAKESGEKFADRRGIANTEVVNEHANYGKVVFYLALVLGLLAIALVVVDIMRARMNELESIRRAFSRSPRHAAATSARAEAKREKGRGDSDEDVNISEEKSSETELVGDPDHRTRLIWACVSTGLSVAMVLVGVAATVYVILAGHSGAEMVWGSE